MQRSMLCWFQLRIAYLTIRLLASLDTRLRPLDLETLHCTTLVRPQMKLSRTNMPSQTDGKG
jgi:hypothetical protein